MIADLFSSAPTLTLPFPSHEGEGIESDSLSPTREESRPESLSHIGGEGRVRGARDEVESAVRGNQS